MSKILKFWVPPVVPVLLLVMLGLTMFRSAVVSSIEGTPHPELVYLIFLGFAVAIFFGWYALYRAHREENVLLHWDKLSSSDRGDFLSTPRARASDLLPVFELLSRTAEMSERNRQAALQSELGQFERRLNDRLTIPAYIGGALIGLGLVGTFVGLLGTLRDLGALFNALIGDTGAQAPSQAEMFKDMILRMQEPMRGMGTAFVASLYGLLASLVVGWVNMNIKKACTFVSGHAFHCVRSLNYGLEQPLILGYPQGTPMEPDERERWFVFFDEMNEKQVKMANAFVALQKQTNEAIQSSLALNEAIERKGAMDEIYAQALSKCTEALHQTNALHASICAAMEGSGKSMVELSQQIHVVGQALAERNRIDALVRKALGEGLHWMNAWDEISVETRKLRQLMEMVLDKAGNHAQWNQSKWQELFDIELRREGALNSLIHELRENKGLHSADIDALVNAVRHCAQTHEEVGSRLQMYLGLLDRNNKV